MRVEFYSYAEKPINAMSLIKLYKQEEWWEERKEENIEEMLHNVISIGAWNDDVLIGFARAVSDGDFRAYIEDVMVDSSYQKSRIGTKLVSKLLDETSHIDVVSLFCEESLIPFYERNNFKLSKSQLVMHRR